MSAQNLHPSLPRKEIKDKNCEKLGIRDLVLEFYRAATVFSNVTTLSYRSLSQLVMYRNFISFKRFYILLPRIFSYQKYRAVTPYRINIIYYITSSSSSCKLFCYALIFLVIFTPRKELIISIKICVPSTVI